MKQFLSFFALLAIYFVSISAHSSRVIAPCEGYSTPDFTLTDGAREIKASDFRGKYLLLTFWSSADAESRVRCNDYETLAANEGNALKAVSVNLDRSQGLYEEVKKYDSLANGMHLYADASTASSLRASFEMNRQLKSFLIGPTGRIEAVNPSIAQIKSIID